MIELLAPAGSFEALEAAINAGADAIYVGGNQFNARAYATNFNLEELKEAVALCHQHGVRLFVTVNTLYQDKDFVELYDYICALYEMQIDALIVQDEGLMDVLKENFPDFEVHASTQCTIHSLDGVNYYMQKGVKRVVLARENSLAEIKDIIAKSNVEIEIFVHGALCVAYSGQCFMSAENGGRSANKGQCAQPCRLIYQLTCDGEPLGKPTHLLSMADLCTIDQVGALIEAGVHSLKIEGRMKRPEYVYAVVSSYRQAIDAYYKNQPYQSDRTMLMQLFNRDFTSGYLFKQRKVVNDRFSGNQGILAARVLHYDTRRKRLCLEALIELHQQDGIRIGNQDHGLLLNKIYVQNKLVNRVEKGTVFEIEDPLSVKKGTEVYRTLDHQLEKILSQRRHHAIRKIPIRMQLNGTIGQPLMITVTDGTHIVTINTNAHIELATSVPLSIERIEEQCRKLGNTPYVLDKIEIYFPENGFISIKALNDLRRQALTMLDQQRQDLLLHQLGPSPAFQAVTYPDSNRAKLSYYVHVETLEQLQAVLTDPVQILFPLNDQFDEANQLAQDYGQALIGVLPAIIKDQEWKLFDQRIAKTQPAGLAIGHPAALQRYGSLVSFGLPGLNLMNGYALHAYPFVTTISMEVERKEVNQLLKTNPHSVAFIYGHPESMRMEHCPVSYYYFHEKRPHCQCCKQGTYELVDRKGAHFAMQFDACCRTTLYHPNLRNWLNYGYSEGYLHFTTESPNEIRKIMKLLNL